MRGVGPFGCYGLVGRGTAVVVHALLDAATAGGATARTPDKHRDEQTDRTDDHQDDADRLNAHAGQRRVHRERQHGADGDEENAEADTHDWLTPVDRAGAGRPAGLAVGVIPVTRALERVLG